jgi:hypothetical protein
MMGLAVFLVRDWNVFLSISIGLLVYGGGILALGTLSREEMDRLHTMAASGPSDLPGIAG